MGELDVPDDSDEDPPAKAKADVKAPDANTKIITKNSFDELELNLGQDVTKLVSLVTPKLKDASAKGANLKFLTEAIKGLQATLSMQEAELLHKTCKELHTKRKKIENEAEKAKKIADEKAAKAEKEAKLGPNAVNDEDYFKDFM